jgi:DNA-directed RNA polymerase specialized sigma24 family protein/ketosteroid isomerase-like protein
MSESDVAVVGRLQQEWILRWDREPGDPTTEFEEVFADLYDWSGDDVLLQDEFDPDKRAFDSARAYGETFWPQFMTLEACEHAIEERPRVIVEGTLAVSRFVFIARLHLKDGSVLGNRCTTSQVWRNSAGEWRIVRDQTMVVPMPPEEAERALATLPRSAVPVAASCDRSFGRRTRGRVPLVDCLVGPAFAAGQDRLLKAVAFHVDPASLISSLAAQSRQPQASAPIVHCFSLSRVRWFGGSGPRGGRPPFGPNKGFRRPLAKGWCRGTAASRAFAMVPGSIEVRHPSNSLRGVQGRACSARTGGELRRPRPSCCHTSTSDPSGAPVMDGHATTTCTTDDLIVRTITEHADSLLRVARRHTACHADAEDAYQRALEIFVKTAHRLEPQTVHRWLHTVVKREAWAVAEQRGRLVGVGDAVVLESYDDGRTVASTEEQLERFEELTRAAEALKRLKPQEVTALVLKAQGLSYLRRDRRAAELDLHEDQRTWRRRVLHALAT